MPKNDVEENKDGSNNSWSQRYIWSMEKKN
jgi:hypothetical protein